MAQGKTCGSASSETASLDLDVILAELKADDWLASDVGLDAIDEPKTSVGTGIERQSVMADERDRDRFVRARQELARTEIELVPLTSDVLDAAGDRRGAYEALNVFDGVHLGSAVVLGEPIVSRDALFPDIWEGEHVDPRDVEYGVLAGSVTDPGSSSGSSGVAATREFLCLCV